jgi:hypothetical protein
MLHLRLELLAYIVTDRLDNHYTYSDYNLSRDCHRIVDTG